MIREKAARTLSGWLVVPLLLGSVALLVWLLIQSGEPESFIQWAGWACVPFLLVLLTGCFTVNPNQARVLQLFGRYAGSVRTDGFPWANPLLRKRRISLRIRNFESSKIKVNDHEGNPIEIAAVVVWRVVDTAEASFEVDDFEHYVKVQSEAAVRNLAT